MDKEMQVFRSREFGDIRVLDIAGEPWFVGKDVAEKLGYSNARKALGDHVDQEDKGVTKCYTPSGIQQMTIINESGLYSLVLSSKLPGAKRFKRWVTSEVLPAIRKTGGYVKNEEQFVETYLPFADETTKALFKNTLNAMRVQNELLEAQQPKVVFADSISGSETSIFIGDMAKLLCQNGVDIGQNRLFEWLRESGYLMKRKGSGYNMPTQRSVEKGLFEVSESVTVHEDGHTTITVTTKVTGKGQVYIMDQFFVRQH